MAYMSNAMRKLRMSFNNSLQRLLNIPKHSCAGEMFVIVNIKSFGELIRNSIHSFMNRLQGSKNLLFSICKSTKLLYTIVLVQFIHCNEWFFLILD